MALNSRAFRNLIIIEAMLAFATTLASPFVSIFLFKRSMLGIISIANFYGLCFAFSVLFCVIFTFLPVLKAWLYISLSYVVLIAYYLSIWLLPPTWMFIVCPPLFGLYVMWFWLPFNFLFCDLTSKGDRSTTIGLTFLLFPAIQLIMPLVGGAVISQAGYNEMFIATATILGVAVFMSFLLLRGKDGMITERARLDFRPFGNNLIAGLVLQGMQDGIFTFLLPLMSLSFTGGEFGVGEALSLLAVGGAAGAVLVARISDKSGDRVSWLRVCALASVPFLLLVFIFPTFFVFMLCIGIAQLTISVVSILIMTMSIDKNEAHKPTALLTRELLLELGRALGVIAIVLTWILWHQIIAGFIVAAIALGASAIAK